MKEHLSPLNARVTEIEQLSIKGVIKLYFSCNLVAYFDLSLHGHPYPFWIYINMCRIYLKFAVVK